MDQELCAAIGQHIGDLGCLLAGREQHRYQTGMGGGEHRQHEFDAIAEQNRDTVAADEAKFTESGRDLRRPRYGLAPRHAAVTADQRLAVGIARGGFRHHRPDVFGPVAKRGHHAIAEPCFQPHGGNGILRPVHRLAR